MYYRELYSLLVAVVERTTNAFTDVSVFLGGSVSPTLCFIEDSGSVQALLRLGGKHLNVATTIHQSYNAYRLFRESATAQLNPWMRNPDILALDWNIDFTNAPKPVDVIACLRRDLPHTWLVIYSAQDVSHEAASAGVAYFSKTDYPPGIDIIQILLATYDTECVK